MAGIADGDGVGQVITRNNRLLVFRLGDGHVDNRRRLGGAGLVVARVGIVLVLAGHGGGVGLGVGADHLGHDL